MNYRLLAKILGLLLLLLGLMMSTCLGYALLFESHREGVDSIDAFGTSVLATAFAGGLMFLWGRKSGREILRKEAIAIVGMGWVVCSVFGAIPYMLCEPHLSPVESLFESTSGFTTTGATVITDLDPVPRSLLLWRSMTQWLGGLGILVLFVALLSYLGVGSKALFRHESSAGGSGGLRARIQDVAMRLWQIYLGLTAVCCLGLYALGMDFFEAVCHAFTAMSTGGFGTRNTSIAAFDSLWIELWLVLFMVLGGINFILYAWLLRGRRDRWKTEEEAKIYLLILFIATFAIAANLVLLESHRFAGRALRDSVFQVVSIMTTTGFSSADFDAWPALSKVILLLLMAIGGCTGSTAGGIKVSRLILFLRTVRSEIVRAYRPNIVMRTRLNGENVDESVRIQMVFFIALAGVTVALGTGLVCLLEPGFDIESGFAAVMATLFNIGPGIGEVGPTRNFSGMAMPTHLLLSFLMILGRLEFFAVIVLFMPSLWKRY